MIWLAHLPGALWFLARGLLTSVVGNISLAVLAVALATSLWLFVTNEENPKEVQTFNSAIPIKFVNAPNDLALANASDASVRITVEATKSDLSGLRSTDFDATVNLGGIGAGQTTIPVDVTSSNGRVNVVGITPSRIDVTIEQSRSKEVPVQIVPNGSPQQGFTAVNQTASPNTATVTGAESVVNLVDSVAAEIGITGARVDVTEDRVDLKPRDARGGELARVKVSPQTARVTVDIQQRDFSREFVVTPAITGLPAAGYNVAAVNVDPALVTISGPLDILQSIDAVKGISTDEISIVDARTDVVRQVQLALPSGVRVQGGGTVRVTVSVKPARGEASFRVVAQIRNVGAGLAVVPPADVTVTLAGDIPVLQSITPESIVVVADAQGLEAGIHAIPLQITPPPGTTVARSDPGQLGVALAPRQP